MCTKLFSSIQVISRYQDHSKKLLLFACLSNYLNITCNEMMMQVTHRWDVKGSPRSTRCTADCWRTSSDPARISWTQCSCLCCSNTPWGRQIQKSTGYRKEFFLLLVRVIFLSRQKPKAANFKGGGQTVHYTFVHVLNSYVVPKFKT